MKISIGSDHGGLTLKNAIVKHLEKQGHEVVDYGTYNYDSCDYPDFGEKAARAVADGECERGIVVCTTGIGISIVANKIKGVRCALCTNTFLARMTREHNDANVLALGGAIVGEGMAMEIVDIFLNTPFSGEAKHQRRIDKITSIENK